MATKKIVEKKTGEKYASKKAMMKHEKNESKAEMKKEYGKPKGPMQKVSPMKQVSKKTAYDVKEASNPKLTASARKNYADNAESAMKQLAKHKVSVKKAPSKMKKC
jgi:hypothetical protein